MEADCRISTYNYVRMLVYSQSAQRRAIRYSMGFLPCLLCFSLTAAGSSSGCGSEAALIPGQVIRYTNTPSEAWQCSL